MEVVKDKRLEEFPSLQKLDRIKPDYMDVGVGEDIFSNIDYSMTLLNLIKLTEYVFYYYTVIYIHTTVNLFSINIYV